MINKSDKIWIFWIWMWKNGIWELGIFGQTNFKMPKTQNQNQNLKLKFSITKSMIHKWLTPTPTFHSRKPTILLYLLYFHHHLILLLLNQRQNHRPIALPLRLQKLKRRYYILLLNPQFLVQVIEQPHMQVVLQCIQLLVLNLWVDFPGNFCILFLYENDGFFDRLTDLGLSQIFTAFLLLF